MTMKRLPSKQYLILAITLCIITSCKMTGNFAIVKRQHEKGYYIETPSFVKNNDNRTTKVKKLDKQSESEQLVTDNFIASVNDAPFVEKEQEARTIINNNYVSPYSVNAVARDSSKKKIPSAPIKNVQGKAPSSTNNKPSNSPNNTVKENPATNKPSEPQKDDRKLDWVSVTGFILCCAALVIMPFGIVSGIAIKAIAGYLAIFAGLCMIAGIIFSIKGYNRINDKPQKLKGKGYALAGVMLSILFFIACFLAFIYFSYYVFFTMP